MPRMRVAQVASAEGPFQIVERDIPEPGPHRGVTLLLAPPSTGGRGAEFFLGARDRRWIRRQAAVGDFFYDGRSFDVDLAGRGSCRG